MLVLNTCNCMKYMWNSDCVKHERPWEDCRGKINGTLGAIGTCRMYQTTEVMKAEMMDSGDSQTGCIEAGPRRIRDRDLDGKSLQENSEFSSAGISDEVIGRAAVSWGE